MGVFQAEMAVSAKALECNHALYAKFKASMATAEWAMGRIVQEEIRELRCVRGEGSKVIMSGFLGNMKKWHFSQVKWKANFNKGVKQRNDKTWPSF